MDADASPEAVDQCDWMQGDTGLESVWRCKVPAPAVAATRSSVARGARSTGDLQGLRPLPCRPGTALCSVYPGPRPAGCPAPVHAEQRVPRGRCSIYPDAPSTTASTTGVDAPRGSMPSPAQARTGQTRRAQHRTSPADALGLLVAQSSELPARARGRVAGR